MAHLRCSQRPCSEPCSALVLRVRPRHPALLPALQVISVLFASSSSQEDGALTTLDSRWCPCFLPGMGSSEGFSSGLALLQVQEGG